MRTSKSGKGRLPSGTRCRPPSAALRIACAPRRLASARCPPRHPCPSQPGYECCFQIHSPEASPLHLSSSRLGGVQGHTLREHRCRAKTATGGPGCGSVRGVCPVAGFCTACPPVRRCCRCDAGAGAARLPLSTPARAPAPLQQPGPRPGGAQAPADQGKARPLHTTAAASAPHAGVRGAARSPAARLPSNLPLSRPCLVNFLPNTPGLSQLLIDGQFVDAKSGKTFEDLDPRTGAPPAACAGSACCSLPAACSAAEAEVAWHGCVDAFDNPLGRWVLVLFLLQARSWRMWPRRRPRMWTPPCRPPRRQAATLECTVAGAGAAAALSERKGGPGACSRYASNHRPTLHMLRVLCLLRPAAPSRRTTRAPGRA